MQIICVDERRGVLTFVISQVGGLTHLSERNEALTEFTLAQQVQKRSIVSRLWKYDDTDSRIVILRQAAYEQAVPATPSAFRAIFLLRRDRSPRIASRSFHK